MNLSGRQLEHPDLVGDVARALADSGLPAAQLTLEITESVMLRSEAMGPVRALKTLGVRLAVDDFGTGYSSLGSLQRFPVDVIKIDRSFVERLGRSDGNASLASAVIALGRALDLSTIAEGIEDASQLAVLRLLGCKTGQGFYFARPLDTESLERLLHARTFTTAIAEQVADDTMPRVVEALRRSAAVVGDADMLVLVGADGALWYATESAGEMLGYDVSEKLGTNILDLVHPDDLDGVLASFVGTVGRPGPGVPIECRLRHADGSVRAVEVVAHNLLDDPEVVGIVMALSPKGPWIPTVGRLYETV